MAFLGGLGKALGLNKQFVEGFAGGFASSVDTKIKKDMEMTQDNIDDLTKISFQSTSAEKKRFQKDLKENTELVEEVMANMGGAEGIKAPLAPVAAHSMIKQLGLKQAVLQSRDYKTNFLMHGQDPIKELELNKKLNGDNPTITLSALAKSTVDPIVTPDLGKLGESANVGFMKANFFGPARDSTKEIETRTDAMLKAAGIDTSDSITTDLPPAVKIKLDPVILGMQDNPNNEIIRLTTMLKNTDRETDPALHTRIKDRIALTRSIVKSAQGTKGLTFEATKSARVTLGASIATRWNIDSSSSMTSPFVGWNTTKKKMDIGNFALDYYMNFTNETVLNSGPNEVVNNNNIILSAAAQGKKIKATTINGIYSLEISTEDVLSTEQKNEVDFGNSKGGDAISKGENNKSNVKMPNAVIKQNKKEGETAEIQLNNALPKYKSLIESGSNTDEDTKEKARLKKIITEALRVTRGVNSYTEANNILEALIRNQAA